MPIRSKEQRTTAMTDNEQPTDTLQSTTKRYDTYRREQPKSEQHPRLLGGKRERVQLGFKRKYSFSHFHENFRDNNSRIFATIIFVRKLLAKIYENLQMLP
jgi:hypothetical protein